jgi:hypothetical protein
MFNGCSSYKHFGINYISGGPAGVDTAVKDAIAIHKSLVTLTPSDHLKLVKVHTAAYKMDLSKLKGWYLSGYFFCNSDF